MNMSDNKDEYIIFKQNPNLDFLFGYFGKMPIPTKQDGYKPIDFVGIDDESAETVLKDFYQRKPETLSVQKFKNAIQEITKDKFKESDKIEMPNQVHLSLSISITEKRFFEVDIDNLAKTVLDSLNGIVYDDDKQVSSLIVDKHIHPLNVNGILIGITKLTKNRKGFQYKW